MKEKAMTWVVITCIFVLGVNGFAQYGPESEKKKLEFEVSGGIALIPGHDEFYSRISGNAQLIEQYVKYYNLVSSSGSGELGKIKGVLPLNFSLNYRVSRGWYIKIGFEFTSGKAATDQDYQVEWAGGSEGYRYRYDYRLAYLMPFFGLEKRFSAFALYGLMGFNYTDFTLNQDFEYSAGDDWLKVSDTYDTRNRTFTAALGSKFMVKMGKKARLLLKAEYLYLKLASFAGEKRSAISNSAGESSTQSREGTIYAFDVNPYGLGTIPYWDLYATLPDEPGLQNVRKMGINLSCFRIMLGYSF